MADITIYKPADIQLTVIDGDPPGDQSALVAQLQADLAAANSATSAVQTKLDALNAADDEVRSAVGE